MKFTAVKIENFKGLKCCETKVDEFTCIIGKNNAGKSSFLQALYLFISGDKLSPKDYFDPEEDIVITVILDEITEHDLEKIPEHRDRIEPHIADGQIKVARRYSTDGKSKWKLFAMIPEGEKFTKEGIIANLSGKKGGEIKAVLQNTYHEIVYEGAVTTQTRAKELIQEYIDDLDDDQKIGVEIDLPTGIDNSIKGLLPEPILIPAVKDLSDDMTTKTTASFGKLLNMLLSEIEEEFTEAEEVFSSLKRKLNRIIEDDEEIDDRIEKIKRVEATIQNNLNETFKNVSVELRIPPPQLKTIFSNADIIADDGVKGSVDDKGDGFKRAITFSIFRTYSELSKLDTWDNEDDGEEAFSGEFLILFEEPELYLHPQAQNIMFEALALLSQKNQTIVTTHSPLFFSADNTKTFIKMDRIECDKPYGNTQTIDLNDMGEKDKFQIISFESANQAFFSDKIVLVEGDTEMILFPHLAEEINPDYEFKRSSISLIKTGGKASFRRYEEFFEMFGIEVFVVCDLDIILNDFNQIDPDNQFKTTRDQLIQVIDRHIEENGLQLRMNNRDYERHLARGSRRGIMNEIRQARADGDHDLMAEKLEEFFDFEATNERLEVLRNPPPEITQLKSDLFAALRENKIFVLERGQIEDYYPPEIARNDKPTMAQNFCREYDNKETIYRALGLITLVGEELVEPNEFTIMFGTIFDEGT